MLQKLNKMIITKIQHSDYPWEEDRYSLQKYTKEIQSF